MVSSLINQVFFFLTIRGCLSSHCLFLLTYTSNKITSIDANNNTILFEGEIKISIKEFMQWQALLDLLRTIFVVLLFYIAIYFFMYDATRLIIDPMEKLLNMVKEMSQNPSRALKLAEKQKKLKISNNPELESIKETITKLAYLLVLGFGRAGDSVISKILYSQNINLQITSKGTTIYGIFGFCDIRNFTDVTEVLGTEVIQYVNTIGHVVHTIVDKYKGGANKNIGDAFLLVWKLNSSESDVIEFTENILTENEKYKIWNQYEPLKKFDKNDDLIRMNALRKRRLLRESENSHLIKEHPIKDHETPISSYIKNLEETPKIESIENINDLDLETVQMMSSKFTNNIKNSILAL